MTRSAVFRMFNYLLLIMAIIAALYEVSAWYNENNADIPIKEFELKALSIGGVFAPVYIANNEAKRRQGLMKQKAAYPGMLLLESEPKIMGVWMKNTDIPLSVAFIDESNTVIQIEHLEPHSLDIVSSKIPVIAALEMPLGWFDENGISLGSIVTNPNAEIFRRNGVNI